MKFGKCNMINIFFEKLCTNCGGESGPRRFLRNKIRRISGSTVLKFYTVCFHCISKFRTSKTYLNKLLTTCFFLHIQLFLKNKKKSGNSLPASCLA